MCIRSTKSNDKNAMAVHCLILFYCYTITVVAAYTLTPSESLADGQTLVSQGGTFELGFFSSSNYSENRYLGIWYKTIPEQTVVWVANRDTPLNDTSGVVRIGKDGNIVISSNQTDSVVWSSNSSKPVGSPIVEFLVSGNLVSRDVRDVDPESYLWQSFDSPSQTLLPGMKLGCNLKTGRKWYMSSWKNWDDPSTGDFTFGVDLSGYLEPYIKKGSKKYYRAGPWNGVTYSGAPDLKPNSIFTVGFVQNAEEVYYMYRLVNQSVIFRLTLTQTGSEVHLQRFTWIDNAKSWVRLVSIPRDRCDDYGLCGIYSTCEVSYGTLCQCLKGFRPKYPQGWSETDWSQGCVREVPVNCSRGEGFRKFTHTKLPETAGSWVNRSMRLEECRVQCLNNCSCIAYATLNVQAGGSGCIMWSTDLIDMRQLSDGGQDLYVRMAASELDSGASSKMKRNVIMVVSITLVAVAIVLSLGSWYIWKKRTSKGVVERDDLELPLYDLVTLATATNNFSKENKLGEGGFGPVYKGQLIGGQEIAVKRLSKDSIQGVTEFKNEVILISKLQHRNLVRLLGCCIQGEEMMLVYEYMQNQSLDSSIFDPARSKLLDWEKRFNIILGIARGLLYLHHDSRLRIIHRDLKASNILLDNEMVPKIADFGMARIFLGDQTDAKTKRVVGTYGYMSPEYVLDGRFSAKSDVFSFGVLILEILSGKKNRSFCHPDHEFNLLGHAWRLRNEGKSMELVDDAMRDSCILEDVSRCIHIGLLCVQKHTVERPTMSSVVLMLSSESLVLPEPQHPGFYLERSTSTKENSSYNSTEVTMTVVEGR